MSIKIPTKQAEIKINMIEKTISLINDELNNKYINIKSINTKTMMLIGYLKALYNIFVSINSKPLINYDYNTLLDKALDMISNYNNLNIRVNQDTINDLIDVIVKIKIKYMIEICKKDYADIYNEIITDVLHDKTYRRK